MAKILPDFFNMLTRQYNSLNLFFLKKHFRNKYLLHTETVIKRKSGKTWRQVKSQADREGGKLIDFHLLVHSSNGNNSWSWLGPEPGAFAISHMDTVAKHLVHLLLFPRLIRRQLDWNWSSCNLNWSPCRMLVAQLAALPTFQAPECNLKDYLIFCSVIKMLCRKPASIFKYLGSNPDSNPNSTFLLIPTLGGNKWWVNHLHLCHPQDRPASVKSCYRLLEWEPVGEALPLSALISLSL